MSVIVYISTDYFDALRIAAMSQVSGQALIDALGRTRHSSAGAWDQRWKHNCGKGMRTTFTVGDDANSKWVRVREEGPYQVRLSELLDKLSLLYGASDPMPPDLAWDYLVVRMPLDRLYFVTGYEHWKKKSRFESRLRSQNHLFVGHHNVEVPSVDTSRLQELYVEVPSWWRAHQTTMEPSRHLCVPSPFFVAYYSNYILRHRSNPVQVESVWNNSRVEMVVFTLISFLVCAREGIGAHSAMDFRLITAGCGVLTPLPVGIVDSIKEMGFFPLLQGCNYNMPFAFLSYFRARETNWYRATVEGILPHPKILYDFASVHPSSLPPYTRRKLTRVGEDFFTEYPGVTPYVRSHVREAMTLHRCRVSYDRYLLARDGPPPVDDPIVPPGSPEP